MQKLYKFFWDCGRMGSLQGVFISTDAEIKAAIGRNCSFGEVLGKHSDIHGKLDADDITEITDNKTVISVIVEHLEGGIGFNPLEYLQCEHGISTNEEYCEDCGEDDDEDAQV